MSDTNVSVPEITFSGSALLGYTIEVIYCFTFNIILFFILRRKRGGYSFKPLIVGFGTYFALSWVRQAFRALLLTDDLKSFPAMWYITSALLSGVIEEIGRYLAFRYALDGYDSLKDGIGYGLGHDFCEMSLGVGTKSLGFLFWGIRCNDVGVMKMITGMDASRADAFVKKLTLAADNSVLSSLHSVIAWLPVEHILLSILVLISVHYVGQKKQLYIAMAIHTFWDVLTPLMLWLGIANIITVKIIPDVLLFVYVYKLWKQLNKETV